MPLQTCRRCCRCRGWRRGSVGVGGAPNFPCPGGSVRLVELPHFIERLAVNDLTAHVARHLRELSAADLDCALGLTALSILVRKRREVPTGILLEFFL